MTLAMGKRLQAHHLRPKPSILDGCARALASNDVASGARALYANFEDKEDLFLAVIREEQAWRANMFPSILTD